MPLTPRQELFIDDFMGDTAIQIDYQKIGIDDESPFIRRLSILNGTLVNDLVKGTRILMDVISNHRVLEGLEYNFVDAYNAQTTGFNPVRSIAKQNK